MQIPAHHAALKRCLHATTWHAIHAPRSYSVLVPAIRALSGTRGHATIGGSTVRGSSKSFSSSSVKGYQNARSSKRPIPLSVERDSLGSKKSIRYLATTSDMSVHRSKYAAVVVGGGAAGITVVGNLLERRVNPILWVDDKFEGGRINRSYREVPSNTKTKLFVDFAEAVEPFRQVIEQTPSPNAVDSLRQLEQDKGCQLGNAGDMLLMLTDGLKRTPGVEVRRGRVTGATVDDSKRWTVELDLTKSDSSTTEPSKVISSRVILCTGSSPTDTDLPVDIPGIKAMSLDDALSPSTLVNILPKDDPVTIAVIGASHSAILVLLNLSNLALTSHPNIHIKWFTRHELRYAEYMEGWVLRDNTGLKGDAATWAKANLEPEVFESSPVSKVITCVNYKRDEEIDTYKKYLPGCQHVVQAIGFTRDPVPAIKRGVGTPMSLAYNHLTGGFTEGKADGQKIPGLYGAGIAWPERVTDPKGNVEYAVGFWKFMKYIKRVSCDWN